MRNDLLTLECVEELYYQIELILKRLGKNKSVHTIKLEQLAEDLKSQRRVLEDISYPARLIVEHLYEIQSKSGQVAVETDQIHQTYALVNSIKVEEFGIITIGLGQLEISWRDSMYSYYLYPDKVELRAMDEKSSVKLFFSQVFYSQAVERFPEILKDPKIVYIHPQLEKWLIKD